MTIVAHENMGPKCPSPGLFFTNALHCMLGDDEWVRIFGLLDRNSVRDCFWRTKGARRRRIKYRATCDSLAADCGAACVKLNIATDFVPTPSNGTNVDAFTMVSTRNGEDVRMIRCVRGRVSGMSI